MQAVGSLRVQAGGVPRRRARDGTDARRRKLFTKAPTRHASASEAIRATHPSCVPAPIRPSGADSETAVSRVRARHRCASSDTIRLLLRCQRAGRCASTAACPIDPRRGALPPSTFFRTALERLRYATAHSLNGHVASVPRYHHTTLTPSSAASSAPRSSPLPTARPGDGYGGGRFEMGAAAALGTWWRLWVRFCF
ncbi:hypothetical protein B0H15DRAFT_833871 [Mycena belliarum]|uniref:Uncharacterized protein n=1 Tax=Mycena belliarum TaxID=1033014 RepID=A0AAD6XSN9_9AGAR|nr:hypothetical protein B0H15DRAFT_833871 [Mycena belliae]